jgi:hypothetical protein
LFLSIFINTQATFQKRLLNHYGDNYKKTAERCLSAAWMSGLDELNLIRPQKNHNAGEYIYYIINIINNQYIACII